MKYPGSFYKFHKTFFLTDCWRFDNMPSIGGNVAPPCSTTKKCKNVLTRLYCNLLLVKYPNVRLDFCKDQVQCKSCCESSSATRTYFSEEVLQKLTVANQIHHLTSVCNRFFYLLLGSPSFNMFTET